MPLYRHGRDFSCLILYHPPFSLLLVGIGICSFSQWLYHTRYLLNVYPMHLFWSHAIYVCFVLATVPRRSMFIQTKDTPNPNGVMFYPGVTVLESGTLEFRQGGNNLASPLARSRLNDECHFFFLIFENDVPCLSVFIDHFGYEIALISSFLFCRGPFLKYEYSGLFFLL